MMETKASYVTCEVSDDGHATKCLLLWRGMADVGAGIFRYRMPIALVKRFEGDREHLVRMGHYSDDWYSVGFDAIRNVTADAGYPIIDDARLREAR